MTRSASAPLMPLDEAVAMLLEGLVPVASITLPPEAALGRIAAHAVEAARDVPGCRAATQDGWAVAAATVTGASSYGPVPLWPAPVWVEAGDGLPEGTDTVLPPEAVLEAEAIADAPTGSGTGEAGWELPAGTLLLGSGERVSPLHLAGLAAAGIGAVAVRMPRLRLVVTGTAAPAEMDALSPLVAALSREAGAEIVEVLTVADDTATIARAIGGDGCDVVLVLAGTGSGRSDRSAEALALAGTLSVHGLALSPGESAGFGEAAGRPVLLLPGRPEAALAAFLMLCRPLLARLSGAACPVAQRAVTRRKITSTIGLTELVFARRQARGVDPLGGVGLPLARLILADCAILVPPGREGFPEGAEVAIMPL